MARILKSQWAISNTLRKLQWSTSKTQAKKWRQGKEARQKLRSISNTDTYNPALTEKFWRGTRLKINVLGDSHTTLTLPLTQTAMERASIFPKPALSWAPVPGWSCLRQLTNKSHCKQLWKDATIMDCSGDGWNGRWNAVFTNAN